jgi:hypothetical protein
LEQIFINPDDSELTKIVIKTKKDENGGLFRKLRDIDRFEDIITHLGCLNPPVFTGEYKKVKSCSL